MKNKKFTKTQFIKELIAALRSGKYKQTIGTLKDSKGYCCLGVASKLFSDAYGIGKFKQCVDDKTNYFCTNEENVEDGVSTYLHTDLAKKLRVSETPHVGIGRTSSVSLINLNDFGVNFKGIAALLETYPLIQESSTRSELYTDDDFDDKERLATLELIFSKTEYAKNWRSKCIRKNSDYSKLITKEKNVQKT